MTIEIAKTKEALGESAAEKAMELINGAIRKNGHAYFIAATGASQFEFLAALTKDPSRVDWKKTTMFHLDEYVGIPDTHPASFRKYMRERFITRVNPGTVHLIEGDAKNTAAECARLKTLISKCVIDVAFVGIGENGHLAFNDPPADFTTKEPYLVVDLDEKCRRQQMGEGWFKTLADVPPQAVSMSVNEIMRANAVIASVPDKRKAQAVADCLTGPVTPEHPSSILQHHPNAFIYLDAASASLLPSAK
ncbi:MAG: glucosamine-6-phosphate deaminase [Spirochaetes bacterium]|nr:glucosamine-6-phosphate deaminase [Spirochaetota bacterium]